ncbi:enoyl-CoA hydratase family protein [Actinoplanes sichuanensis]|uniref:Enoyl-CoA hydratase-related protein n=1 Tax=Actinoplanes sichuanensis TaxID=512349 RepID=A0ABW4ARC4_9ACTN|nr:enoyl-CoA hydratase-related protein [Actinoplanes sichuanensis]BEL04854.1 enoyl-CoA hydratase family protein [Actinoplanes sichuanensis]
MSVLLDTAGGVATITLDSPHNRNALSRQLMTELSAHLAAAGRDPAVRAVLLRSSGRVFCSGADLGEARQAMTSEAPRALVALQRQIATLPRPVVVELAGPVRAGGLGLVGAADVVIAAASVTFALTEVRLGLAPSAISLSLLEKLTPRAAADVFLSGRTFDAAEAAAIGLVTRAVPDDELPAAVAATLAEMVQGSRQGLAETKRLLTAALVDRIDRDGDAAAERSAELFATPEAQRAMQAFLTRAKPPG